MNISALLQNTGIYNTSKVSGSTQSTQSTQTLQDSTISLSRQEDSVSISTEGLARAKMPPPPEKVDFSSMSDEDLVSFLQQMQEEAGTIPDVEDAGAASVSSLSSEQLQNIREQLTEMSAQMDGMRSMGRRQGPPPPPMDVQNMSDDALKSLLEQIKEDTGSIPGIEDPESTEVSSLDAEQLQSAREALEEMMQKRMEEMIQSRAMSHAASAYESTASLSL